MRRLTLLPILAVAAATLAACLPTNPGPSGLYLGVQDGLAVKVSGPEGIEWGSAPPIDDSYGGTLYPGTAMEVADPRPALRPDGTEPLRLWAAVPDNDLSDRPAIIWIHGGGFAKGVDSMYGLARTSGRDYASRGYVSISVEYRIDTTLVGAPGDQHPPSLCQWVQDNVVGPTDPGYQTWAPRKEQCERNVRAAQHDAQAAVRFVRHNAERFGVDPAKVAVAGFSAGAVTAADLAYRSDDVGDVRYFPGDDLSVESSKVQAAIGASGCTYPDDLHAAPSVIGAGDAPISFIASALDPAVPYRCVRSTVVTARRAGLVAELTSYCGSADHAQKLYRAHKDETDEQWTTFLARELGLYRDMPAPTRDPVCR